MKKLILFSIIFTTLTLTTKAENWFKEGTIWNTEFYPEYPNDEISYTKSWLSPVNDDNGNDILGLFEERISNESEPVLKAFIKTEGEKVFFRNIDEEEGDWYLLFDFDLNEGEGSDVWLIGTKGYDDKPYTSYLKCVQIIENDPEFDGWTTMRMEEWSKYNQSDETYLAGTGVWIKGLGGSKGPESNMYLQVDGLHSKLLSVTYNDEMIYKVESAKVETSLIDNIKISIQGLKVLISGINENLNVSIYTLDGKNVFNKISNEPTIEFIVPEPGVYLISVNGKTTKIKV